MFSMRLAALTISLSLAIAPSAMAAGGSSPPVQVAPSGGATQATPQGQAPATPQVAPGSSSIPIPDASNPDPELVKEEKAQKKRQQEQLYALLVFGAALLPVLVFLAWKFWPRASDFKPARSRHTFATGPADKRRIKRRQQRK